MKQVCDTVRAIAARHPGIERIVLFGSRARGTHRHNSDYDFAVFGNCPPAFVIEMEEGLETLSKLDVVFVDEDTDKALLEQIERDGVTIYDRLSI